MARRQIDVDNRHSVQAKGEDAPLNGQTLGEWGTEWLKRREREGHRSVRTDRSRWRAHVLDEPISFRPLTELSRSDVRAWLSSLLTKRTAEPFKPSRPKLAAQTIRNALNLLRVALEAAVEAGLVDGNVAREVRVPRGLSASTRETWTVLDSAEQTKLLAAVPSPERWIVQAALGTGLRLGELWSLRLSDVHLERQDPFLVVRFGWHDSPTKSGSLRRVPLFGLALEAFDGWTGVLSTWAPYNPRALVFPTRRGKCRDRKAPHGWREWLRAAEIGRRVRWHDLRHTCASSLLAGWWGRSWSLEEVRALLGHSSVIVTERYAHFAFDALTRAADESDESRRRPELAKARPRKALPRVRVG